jgi:hypothetical protein
VVGSEAADRRRGIAARPCAGGSEEIEGRRLPALAAGAGRDDVRRGRGRELERRADRDAALEVVALRPGLGLGLLALGLLLRQQAREGVDLLGA